MDKFILAKAFTDTSPLSQTQGCESTKAYVIIYLLVLKRTQKSECLLQETNMNCPLELTIPVLKNTIQIPDPP